MLHIHNQVTKPWYEPINTIWISVWERRTLQQAKLLNANGIVFNFWWNLWIISSIFTVVLLYMYTGTSLFRGHCYSAAFGFWPQFSYQSLLAFIYIVQMINRSQAQLFNQILNKFANFSGVYIFPSTIFILKIHFFLPRPIVKWTPWLCSSECCYLHPSD